MGEKWFQRRDAAFALFAFRSEGVRNEHITTVESECMRAKTLNQSPFFERRGIGTRLALARVR